jgi:hypothetical protein
MPQRRAQGATTIAADFGTRCREKDSMISIPIKENEYATA